MPSGIPALSGREESHETVARSRVLTPHASAILLDPEYGLPAARRRHTTAGLLLAYEQSGYDKSVAGRLPRLPEQWCAQRLVEEGANAVKILRYYSIASSRGTNEAKHAFVERAGAECAVDVLAKKVPILVVKRGALGAVLRSKSANFIATPSTVEVADSVGAGDRFDAGIIHQFVRGKSPQEGLQFATSTGALSVTRAGVEDFSHFLWHVEVPLNT